MSLSRFFKPIPADQRDAYTAYLAEQARLAVSSFRPPPPSNPVGRPRAKRPVELQPAAAAAEEGENKKRKYVQWFASPLIHEILAVYRMERTPRSTVAVLHRRSPALYADLGESTVRSWFDDENKLLPRFAALLASGIYPPGPGRTRVFADHPEVEQKIMEVLLEMRERATTGITVNIETIRWVMQSVISEKAPQLLDTLTLSRTFISQWAGEHMQWTWRAGTSTASKLPVDWHEQGVAMAQRVAVCIETYDVHPSLVINMDQAGLHLVPAASRTYETKGSRSVLVAGLDDKRQITVCVASTLNGDLLPLQLIFMGKTSASLPQHTEETKKLGFHLTFSSNHWSSQETMQQFVEHIIAPHRAAMIVAHKLKDDAALLLQLDVWAVHISKEFRAFLAEKYKYIHLVYVPANCTSKLQVADLALNYPFKHGFKRRFNAWAAQLIDEQIKNGEVVGIKPFCGMTLIKPKVLEWALESWKSLANEKLLILKGWQMCLVSLYDVHNKEERVKALRSAVRDGKQAPDAIPEEKEEEVEVDEDGFIAEESEDEEKTEKEIMKERVYGERKSQRHAPPPKPYGYQLSTAQLKFS